MRVDLHGTGTSPCPLQSGAAAPAATAPDWTAARRAEGYRERMCRGLSVLRRHPRRGVTSEGPARPRSATPRPRGVTSGPGDNDGHDARPRPTPGDTQPPVRERGL